MASVGRTLVRSPPSVAVESSLSLILQDNVPARFTLSPRACRGILARAERRGRALPPELEEALTASAAL